VLAAAVRHVQLSGRPVGGSGALAEAVGSALRSAGGSIRCGAAVERVLVEAARVRGVRLVGGEEITAPVVVAAVDPRRLHMEWLAGVAPVPGWIAPTPPHGYESKLDVVVDRLSGYRGVHSEIHGVADALVPTATVTPGVDAVAAAHAGMAAGVVAERPVMYANWPSVTDPSLVGAGEHLLGLEVLFTPYRLNGGWEGSAEPERWLEVFARKMEPGFLESVQRWRLVSPADYEADFGLERGFVPSFAGTPLSAVLGRPPELTRYRSPIKGLYLTGGATFPGAGIWGASGRNAAGAVLADR
jgi:phytoene dehydrogenase-like protein